jgi:hypothetical protein
MLPSDHQCNISIQHCYHAQVDPLLGLLTGMEHLQLFLRLKV